MKDVELKNLVKGWQNKETESTNVLMGMAYCKIKEIAIKYHKNLPNDANTAIYCQTATDLVHDAYERLLQAESRLPIDTLREFYSYLNATVRNTFIDNYRKLVTADIRNPDKTHLDSVDALMQPGPCIEQLYELSSLSSHLTSLAKDYPRQAEVVELRYYGQQSNKAIARLLSISLRTVENDLRFAKSWIKLKIQ
ncbi:hypothetical protein DS885_07870 [Psychromonas sp. B3M02]|uniref:sigma-70 family RNA polymerase sigma factor n=1 Tax=Psychromonas sp. B3M02 TaxID=2267226 RepID=UPI000DE8A47B|nr:sigma-70 family RNA polymerase sigma factor [Psychromonas sp. B3M02]RBW46512.1 hypothetical protein DS885_07870 [Psychromonas sp. B3M02]